MDDQRDVNRVWSNVWREKASAKSTFSNRLFIEGYRVFKPLVPAAKDLLEIGTGSGRYAIAFARDFPQMRVYATDIVPESLEHAKQLAEEVGVRNISFERADVQALQYKENSFDVVFSDAVIQHVPDEQRAVREMARVLRPGGVLLLAVVNRYSLHNFVRVVQRMFEYANEYGSEKFYSRYDLRALALYAGLEPLAYRGLYPAYGIYRLKRHHPLFEFIGKALNRVTRFLDAVTGQFMSSRFGFEIVLVAKKPYSVETDSLGTPL